VDGTVRAFDLLRYRNFRTFTSPQPAAFASLAVDAAGEVVAAGTADSFEIYVWAMQTGRLLDVLSGHEGPVSALAFTPVSAVATSLMGAGQALSLILGGYRAQGTAVSSRILLASGSWDSSVRLWDVFSGRGGAVETFENSYDVLSLCFRPDGQQLAVCALDGSIKFWSTEGELEQTIEGRYDVRGGRGTRDVRAAEHNAASHHFTTLAYSADGGMVLAGGNSRWVCLYDAASKVLLQRFEISTNTSLDGVVDRLNSKNDGEAGPVDLIDDPDDDSDLENDYDRQRRDKFDAVAVAGGEQSRPAQLTKMPRAQLTKRPARPSCSGAKDDGRRSTPRRIRVHCVRFCPTGHGWCAATTEGLMLFRSDRGGELMFDPSDLEMELTRQSVLAHAHGRPEGADGSAAVAPNASLALMGSLRLGEPDVVREAVRLPACRL
jgi:periodic tryptophan protein 2